MPTALLLTVWGEGEGLYSVGSAQPWGSTPRRVCIWGVCIKRGFCPTLGGSASRGGWADPLPLSAEWHTGVKTLPCPKLRLRVVTSFLLRNHQTCGICVRNEISFVWKSTINFHTKQKTRNFLHRTWLETLLTFITGLDSKDLISVRVCVHI